MKGARAIIAAVLLTTSAIAGTAAAGGKEFPLLRGNLAVIEGKRLILIDAEARRSVAPPGRYETRDGRYAILVKADGLVVLDRAKELK